MQQEERAEHDEHDAPRDRVAVEPVRNGVGFGVGHEAGAEQLRRAEGVHRGEEPHAKRAEDKEGVGVCHRRHLEEAGEDGEVDDRFRDLAVVGRAEAGQQKRQQ